MNAGSALRSARTAARAGAIRLRTRDWADGSRLFVLGDALGWALDDEAAYVDGRRATSRDTGSRRRHGHAGRAARPCSTRATSPRSTPSGPARRIGSALAYFHGRPGRRATRSSTARTQSLARDPARFARIQVTHREMEELVLVGRRRADRVHRIPIGIELERFPARRRRRDAARRAAELGLPRERIRRRLVPEGRRRLRRRARAEDDQGPGRARRRAPARRDATRTTSSCSSPVLRAATCGTSSTGTVSGMSTGCCRDGTGSRRRTTRSTCTSSRRGRRAGRRASSSRWRRASRSSRPASGRRRTSSSTARTGSSSTSTTPTRSPPRIVARPRRTRRRREHARRGPADGRGELACPAGAALGGAPRGVRRARWIERAPRGTDVQRRAGLASSSGGRARRGLRVFYGWDADPGARASPWRGAPRSSRSLRSGGRTARRTSRCSTSARRTCRATCARCSGSRGGGGARDRRQPGRRRVSRAGREIGRRSSTFPLRRAVLGADHVVYQSAFSKRSSDEFLGEPRGTWEILPNAVDVERFTPGTPTGRRPRRSSRRRPDPGVPARARARDLPPRARRASRRPPARERTARVRSGSARCGGSGSRARSSSSAATRRPRRQTCSEPRTCSSTRRSTTRARRRSSRRSRAASRSRIARAAARWSSSATRRASASRIRTASTGTSHRRRRRSPRPSAPSSSDRERYARAARQRAVERFALDDWLERHAAIFAELTAR